MHQIIYTEKYPNAAVLLVEGYSNKRLVLIDKGKDDVINQYIWEVQKSGTIQGKLKKPCEGRLNKTTLQCVLSNIFNNEKSVIQRHKNDNYQSSNLIVYKRNDYIILNEKDAILQIETPDECFSILIDTDDIEKLQQHIWYVEKNGYVRSGKDNQKYMIHRYIMNVHLEERNGNNIVDHLDRDTFNNRKSNLRITTDSENNRNKGLSLRNTSGVKGVIKRVNPDGSVKNFTASWIDKHTGKECTQQFSVNKLGHDLALQMAAECRSKMVKLNY